MNKMFVSLPLSAVFKKITRGHFHATAKTLTLGSIPLISCKQGGSGVTDYFDVQDEFTFENAVTIAANGQPLTSFFHPYKFTANDDIIVCVPKEGILPETILYVVAYLNRLKWRFSYGRKCYRKKIDKIRIAFPAKSNVQIDEVEIRRNFPLATKSYLPEKTALQPFRSQLHRFKAFKITDLFRLKRGDFHSLSKLIEGEVPTVSRTSFNNGIIGNFEPPEDSRIYPAGLLTISTVAGDAFIQMDEFIATDNIVICFPKTEMQLETLIFIAFVLNRQKWRYSYGRQCYKKKLEQTVLYLPAKENNEIDESLMREAARNTSYWDYVSNSLSE